MRNVNHQKTIVQAENVSFTYTKETVVKDVSLSIYQGDYVGIVGPNGGGKSTLIKLLLGILKPAKGKIFLFGSEIRNFRDWSKIGYVPQRTTIDINFPITVEEVVTMGRYGKLGIFHSPGKIDRDKVLQALENVEMSKYRKSLIHDLSGGQQQRIFIARALAAEPEVIFLDEPTVGVDVKTQKQFYRLLRKLNRQLKLTLILASHELDIIAHESTELGYINCTLEYYGEPTEFIKGAYFHDLIGIGGLHH